MDPQAITTAILAAISAGLISGIKDSGQKLVEDSLNSLISKLLEKLGKDNKVSKAIEEVRQEPDFKPHETTLQARIEQSDIANDEELVAVIKKLQDALKSHPASLQQVNISDEAQVGIVGDNAKVGSIVFNSKGA